MHFFLTYEAKRYVRPSHRQPRRQPHRPTSSRSCPRTPPRSSDPRPSPSTKTCTSPSSTGSSTRSGSLRLLGEDPRGNGPGRADRHGRRAVRGRRHRQRRQPLRAVAGSTAATAGSTKCSSPTKMRSSCRRSATRASERLASITFDGPGQRPNILAVDGADPRAGQNKGQKGWAIGDIITFTDIGWAPAITPSRPA